MSVIAGYQANGDSIVSPAAAGGLVGLFVGTVSMIAVLTGIKG